MAARIPAHPEPQPELRRLELEVLRQAAAGGTVETTAAALHYSTGYVRILRRRACAQLGAVNMPTAVAAAFRHGLLR